MADMSPMSPFYAFIIESITIDYYLVLSVVSTIYNVQCTLYHAVV